MVEISLRSIWARTNHAYDAIGLGLKKNTPDGWATEPHLYYGSDNPYSFMSGPAPSGYAAITKATSIVVNRLASSDWSVGNQTPRWIADPMLCRPDNRFVGGMAWIAGRRLPGPYFWGQWIRYALLSGMGWFICQLDSSGQPVPGTMLLLRPDAVQPTEDGGRKIVGQDGGSVEVGFDNTFSTGRVTWLLVELRNPTTPIDPTTGYSVGTLAHHMIEMGTVAAIAAYSAGTYTGNGIPSGFLKVTSPQMTQPQADKLKEEWMKAHGSGRRSVAVLTSTVDYSPISVTPVDAALAEMKRLSLVDVANAFCVPLFMLGAPPGHSNVYSNVATEQQALWVHTLQPWAKSIEATVSALLPTGTDLKIELPPLTFSPEPEDMDSQTVGLSPGSEGAPGAESGGVEG